VERELITTRVQPQLLAEIRADLIRQDQHSADPAVDVTDWIHRACRDYLAHRARSRAKRKRRKADQEAELLDSRWRLATPDDL
jgi:hypothetical protein